MGALASNRKRGDNYFGRFGWDKQTPQNKSPEVHVSKKPRFSSVCESLERSKLSSNITVSRISRYPETKPPLPIEVHAPCRSTRFGIFSSRLNEDSRGRRVRAVEEEDFAPVTTSTIGNSWSSRYENAKRSAFDTLRCWKKDKEVVVEEIAPGKGMKSNDSSVEEVFVIEDGLELGGKVVEDRNLLLSSSSVVTELNNGSLRVVTAQKRLDSMSLNHEAVAASSLEAYKELLEAVERRTPKLKHLGFEIEFNEKYRASIRALQPVKKPEEKLIEDVPLDPFIPLSAEDETEVDCAFSANRRKVLVSHENSNIDITGQILQCLRPGAWLNDEVINLYLELLKERERREPKRFLKCHFFNTFFYKKLVSGETGYNYKAVKRWTSERKLGYCLLDCDKIFVPIHKEVHWCLAVINKKDQKFQYLDSLKGVDRKVLKALARYYVEETKDKSKEDVDISNWEQEYVEDLPEQENGFDCGMFMLKYVDFYSRGLGLCFNQEHMPYFRLRTAKEVLRLRAD